jgi:transposase
VNEALASLDAEFEALCTGFGRRSIPPERLIRASLTQILFPVRSERQFMEQMQYNLLFRWFVGLGIDDPVWVPTVFTRNRNRLLTTEMSPKVMAAILAHREVAPLLSDEHFSVDGTLVKAWASMKSFQPKADDTPPDEDPDSPPGPDTPAEDQPETTETDPMPRPNRHNRNAEVVRALTRTDGVRALTPGRETAERHPCLHHRPGRAALQEISGHRGHAVLHRPCPDG